MAYTSIIPVHRLDNSLDYIKDKDKTVKGAEAAGSLEEAIDYALNREKTEQMVFVDSIGCICESAYADMVSTKERFHKLEGVQGYHLIQSFASGEVTPELAHLIGQELADQVLKGRFEAVITTHLNTSHYHNHIVFNSVSMADGGKYHSNSQSYYEEVRRLSDGLCRKYGLSVIQTSDGKGKPYAEWKAEQENRATWRTGIRMDIREAVQDSFTWNQFVSQMEYKGYEWKLNRKYIALRAPGMERYVRLKSLGKNYSESAVREWILNPRQRKHLPAGKELPPGKSFGKRSGLQALYYSYLYQMGVLKRKPQRSSYLVREDIRHLDLRIAQWDFLLKHEITTREQLFAYRKPLEETVLALTKERHRLYRTVPKPERVGEITELLKPLRKEIKMCVQIERHSLEIERRMAEVEVLKREKKEQKDEKNKDALDKSSQETEGR